MATVGIFDSGIGGLSVYREIRKMLPLDKVLYFADTAYCPYGEKTQDFIAQRASEITEYLLFKGADIIVVACNTATSAAIKELREAYTDSDERVSLITGERKKKLRFIGMEPAIKPAADETRSGVVGVLATAGTLGGAKYLDLKETFGPEVLIAEHVGEGFVELVESGELTGPRAEQVISASLQPLLDAGADTIVLGCTHYPFLKQTIQQLAGPDVQVIDPAPAVVRQLIKVMDEEGIPHSSPDTQGGPLEPELLSSWDRDTLVRAYHRLIK